MRAALFAAFTLVVILPCFWVAVLSVSAGHELAKPYGMNTPPSLFQNSTERGAAAGALFRENNDPNGSILPSLSPAEWLLIAAIVVVVAVSLLAVRKKPQTDMHLERS